VARILIRDPEELRETDISQPVLEVLMASKVREVHMIGRRGPAQAKFTTKELRELGELAGVDVVIGDGEHDLDAFDASGESAKLATSDRHVRGNYTVINGWATKPAAGAARRLTLRFWLSPAEILGSERVEGLRLERTRLDADGRLTGTGEFETLPVQLVLRSVGYQSVPLPGVPFDDRSHVVPNAEGRVLGPDGQPLPGEYVAGWLKRGPTGVIGTNKSDATQTVRALLADLAGGPGPDDAQLPRAGLLPLPEPQADDSASDPSGPWSAAFGTLLAERGIKPISYDDWLKIENAEKDLAAALGRGARVKLASRAEIHAACGLDRATG
jgi:ferredoxin--NADP+ reductase